MLQILSGTTLPRLLLIYIYNSTYYIGVFFNIATNMKALSYRKH